MSSVKEKGAFNYTRWIILALGTLLLIDLFHTLQSDAESDLWARVFRTLATLVVLSGSVIVAVFSWRKNSASKYTHPTTVRWLALTAVVLGVLVVLMSLVFPVR
jgi:cytochrome bd-type quinol oxidase subunit 2